MPKKKPGASKSKPLVRISTSSAQNESSEGKAKGRASSKHPIKKGKLYSGKVQWEQLSTLGLKIREVIADGNCFFRAVADQLEGSQASHGLLRRKTVDYIESQEENFKPFVEDDLSFKEYCQSMRQDGTWAGHMELQAISLLTRCNICIHRPRQASAFMKYGRAELSSGVSVLLFSYACSGMWFKKHFSDSFINVAVCLYISGRVHPDNLMTECVYFLNLKYQSPRWHIRNFGDSRARAIHISYHDGEHYNSVRLIDDETWEPAKPIFIQSDEQLASKPVPQKDRTSSASRNVKADRVAGTISHEAKNPTDTVARKKVVVDTEEDETTADKGSSEKKEENLAEKTSSHKDEARDAATVSNSKDDRSIPSEGEAKAKTTSENSSQSGRLKKSLKGDQTSGRNQPCPCGSKKKYKVCCGVVVNSSAVPDRWVSEKLSNKERKVRVKDEVMLYNRRRPIRLSTCQVEEPTDVADMGALCI